MKIQLLFLFSIFLSANLLGQSKIQWDYSYNAENNTVEIKATVAEGWHLYSQHVANDIGPVPTSFVFDANESLKLIGIVTEPTPIQEYDENFEAMLDFFENEVVFSQRVAVKKDTILGGTVTYMLCNDTMCLPPVDEKFTIELKK
jgi:thiol:disulfide interchange protein DsbD